MKREREEMDDRKKRVTQNREGWGGALGSLFCFLVVEPRFFYFVSIEQVVDFGSFDWDKLYYILPRRQVLE